MSNLKINQWHCLGDQKFLQHPISIPSASPAIDKLFFPLFKGIPTKNISEITGLPGSGKTCFAIQSCINVLMQNPNNSVIYIDTSLNFTVERFYQIYRAKKINSSTPVSDLLNRMLILPAIDIYDIFMQLIRIENLISEMSSNGFIIKLLVIDNVASPFKRISNFTMDRRIKIIDKLGRDLRKISVRYNCAVLTMNQFTRRVQFRSNASESSKEQSQYELIPRLGQTWRNHLDTCISFIGDQYKGRYVMLTKSNVLFEPLVNSETIISAKGKIKYNLTEEGFVEL